MSQLLKVGSFNILADGLSSGEFLCEGGDAVSTEWSARRDKIVSILANMLLTCDAVVTQENDHFTFILEALRETHDLPVGGVFGVDLSKPSRARKLKSERQLSKNQVTKLPDSTLSEYEICNQHFQSNVYSSDENASFADESPTFGATFASIYHNDTNDLYRSDDGLGIYYRTDRLNLEAVHIPGRVAHLVATPNMTIVTNVDYAVACTFQLCTAPTTVVTLYGAHLRSGEDVSMEHARCRQLYAILDDAQHRSCPIVAMDSNSSVYYEHAYPFMHIPVTSPDCESTYTPATNASPMHIIGGKLSTLIKQYDFVDAVGSAYQHGNECFKMRHGQGGQPSKHYQFIFDAIDKILVPATTHIVPHEYDRSEFGFTRYDTTVREELTQLRTSAEARGALARQCRGSARVNGTTCSVEAFGSEHMLAGLYPNRDAPSDHPPVSCCIVLNSGGV
jgi:hypothetical protein